MYYVLSGTGADNGNPYCNNIIFTIKDKNVMFLLSLKQLLMVLLKQ